jgi:hypothetical protein
MFNFTNPKFVALRSLIFLNQNPTTFSIWFPDGVVDHINATNIIIPYPRKITFSLHLSSFFFFDVLESKRKTKDGQQVGISAVGRHGNTISLKRKQTVHITISLSPIRYIPLLLLNLLFSKLIVLLGSGPCPSQHVTLPQQQGIVIVVLMLIYFLSIVTFFYS